MAKAFPRLTVLSLLRGLIAVVFLISFIVISNIIQTLSLFVYPISRPLFRRINHDVTAMWWGANFVATTIILGHKLVFTGQDAIVETENAIVIANHQSMADIPCMMALAHLKKSTGKTKFFAKYPLKWVPGIGWGMQFNNYIFLKRDWMRDANSVLNTFQTLRQDQIPFWLINFPEGTRVTPEKLTKSQAFARQRNLKVLNNLLIPRTKGVTSTIAGLRGHFDAFYDMTIAFGKKVPSLGQFYFYELDTIHLHTDRVPATQLNRPEPELAIWLQERFGLKDERLEHYKKFGTLNS
jgi:1-acyl-sn-glycerol-3-phosphate acyltransferase